MIKKRWAVNKIIKLGDLYNYINDRMGMFILLGISFILGCVFMYYLGNNRTFVLLSIFMIFMSSIILVSAYFFFLRSQRYFHKWADAIRYSRYPATMVITNFSIIAFIAWLKVNTEISKQLTLPLFLATVFPFIMSSLCYGFCAYHTLYGNLLDKDKKQIMYHGRLAVIFWKMGQIFLVSALVPITALVILIATYVI